MARPSKDQEPHGSAKNQNNKQITNRREQALTWAGLGWVLAQASPPIWVLGRRKREPSPTRFFQGWARAGLGQPKYLLTKEVLPNRASICDNNTSHCNPLYPLCPRIPWFGDIPLQVQFRVISTNRLTLFSLPTLKKEIY